MASSTNCLKTDVVNLYSVEVGARGISAKPFYNPPKDLGLSRSAVSSILERASKAALTGSYQIWLGRERNTSSGDDKESLKRAKCRIPQTCPEGRTQFYRRPKPLVHFGQNSRLQTRKADSKPSTPVRFKSRSRFRTLSEEGRPVSSRVDNKEPELIKRELLLPIIPTKLPIIPNMARLMSSNEPGKSIITVPLIQNTSHENKTEDSNKYNLKQLNQDWQQMVNIFENAKSELEARQTNILDLYELMMATQKRMIAMGHDVNLPLVDDIKFSIVPKSLPNHINKTELGDIPTESEVKLNKLYEIPLNLVAVCEKSISHNKSIIDWLNSLLKSKSKEISIHNLVSKITDFNNNNEILKKHLVDVKVNYLEKVQDIMSGKRNVINNVAMHLEGKDTFPAKSDRKSSNNLLEKKNRNKGELSNSMKTKIRDLEDCLQEEKYHKTILEGRCIQAEIELKSGAEENQQLQNTLTKARSLTEALEQRVQLLEDEIKNIQCTFEVEIKALNDILNEKNQCIFDMTSVQDQLQSEKDDLEKQLKQSIEYQKECLKNMKNELDSNIDKCNKINEKYNTVVQRKEQLEKRIESIIEQNGYLESMNNELTTVIKDYEEKLKEAALNKIELVDTKSNLKSAQLEINNYATKLQEKSNDLDNNKVKMDEILNNVDNLNSQIKSKDDYIEKLENKHRLLEQEIYDNEGKMEIYESQLTMLKNKLDEFRKEFQQMPNFKELQTTIYNQDAKLLEYKKEKIQLTESFQNQIEEKNALIKDLTKKQDEYSKKKWTLENRLDKVIYENNILNGKIDEKEEEIQSLTKSLQDHQTQIYNLEKIVLALNEPTERSKLQRKRDHETIAYLKEKISEYKLIINKSKKHNVENMNKFFDTFENEPNVKPKVVEKHSRTSTKINNIETFECHDNGYVSSAVDKRPKIVMENFVTSKYTKQINSNETSSQRKSLNFNDNYSEVYSSSTLGSKNTKKIRKRNTNTLKLKIAERKNNAYGDMKNAS